MYRQMLSMLLPMPLWHTFVPRVIIMKKKKKTPKKSGEWLPDGIPARATGWGKPRQPRWEGKPRWTDADPEWGKRYYGRRPYGEDDVGRRTWYIRDRSEQPKKDYLREAICALAAIQILVLTYLVL